MKKAVLYTMVLSLINNMNVVLAEEKTSAFDGELKPNHHLYVMEKEIEKNSENIDEIFSKGMEGTDIGILALDLGIKTINRVNHSFKQKHNI